jgi:ankyrin repeat protein
MRDQSGTMSVAVMMLRVVVLLFLMRGNVVSQAGNTALLLACWSGHIDVARWLVSEAGSDARLERDNVCCCDDGACVSVVVRHCGVLGDVVSQAGYTALLLACYHGHIDVARWLVSEAGSDARSERNNVRNCACCSRVSLVITLTCVCLLRETNRRSPSRVLTVDGVSRAG